MKQLSSMITGPGLQRLEHAADAGAAGDVDVGADLRAAADGRPGVDHRALADIGADIDEARHQHGVAADEGAAPHDRAGHRAEARGVEPSGVPAFELGRDLVVPGGAARPLDQRIVG